MDLPFPNKKDHIMAVAMELFSEQGYKNTSIKKIAHTAGVSQGLMYNYFSGKEALLAHIFKTSIDDIRNSFTPATSSSDSELHPFEQYILRTFEIIGSHRQFWRLFHSVRMQAEIQELLKSEIGELQSEIFQQLTTLLSTTSVLATPANVRLLFATIDGIAGHFLLDNDYPLEEVMQELIHSYIK